MGTSIWQLIKSRHQRAGYVGILDGSSIALEVLHKGAEARSLRKMLEADSWLF